MTGVDLRAICLCACAALGAYGGAFVSVSYVVPLGLGVMMLIVPRFMVLCSFVAGLTLMLSAAAWHGLDAPLPSRVDAVALVVSDPDAVGRATVSEVDLDGRRYQVWAYGKVASELGFVAAGDHVRVAGDVSELRGRIAPTKRRQHVAGNINAHNISYVDDGNVLDRTANRLRSLVADGATQMPADERSLLTGFVYGDDRNTSDAVVTEFRNAGLAHLTAVSGQNVAFVLLLCAPLLLRFGIRSRFIGGVGVLVLFGFITRWEPSVVRAEMMAVVGLIAFLMGRPITKWQCLGLGTTVALVADPFLVGSVGFLLSVSACVGMAALGATVERALRGPKWVRQAVGYSVAAQLGVLPIEIIVFERASAVGLMTNVIAEPLSAFVMLWGVVAGLTAGLVEYSPLQWLLHVPDTVALWVVGRTAHYGSALQSTAAGKAVGLLASAAILIFLLPVQRTTSVDHDERVPLPSDLSHQRR